MIKDNLPLEAIVPIPKQTIKQLPKKTDRTIDRISTLSIADLNRWLSQRT